MAQGLNECPLPLAREAVALPNWRWERGMVLLWGRERPLVWKVHATENQISVLTILSSRGGLDAPCYLGSVVDGITHWQVIHALRTEACGGPLPDLSHSCTLALVRERVRELRGDAGWTPVPLWSGGEDIWVTDVLPLARQTRYGSEGAAMVAALREGA